MDFRWDSLLVGARWLGNLVKLTKDRGRPHYAGGGDCLLEQGQEFRLAVNFDFHDRMDFSSP